MLEREAGDSGGFAIPGYLQELFASFSRTASMGIVLLDADTRYQALNAQVAGENGLPIEQHLGRTAREVVGDLVAAQLEPIFTEVCRTGKPASILLNGQVRNHLDTGYWLNRCYPVIGRSGKVEQVAVLVANASAENVGIEFFRAMAKDAGPLRREVAQLLPALEVSIAWYYAELEATFDYLFSCGADHPDRKTAVLGATIVGLDARIRETQDVVFNTMSRFLPPSS